MSMGERIKKLRQEKHLTQQKFADYVDVKRNTVALYEADKITPSAAVISLICREFSVNSEWLRNGEGEMFAPTPTDDLGAYFSKLGIGDKVQAIIRAYIALPSDKRRIVDEYIDAVIAEAIAEPAPVVEPKPDGISDEEWEMVLASRKRRVSPEKGLKKGSEAEREALHAELDRQLDLEKKGLPVSICGSSDTAAVIGRKILAASPEAQAQVGEIIELDTERKRRVV